MNELTEALEHTKIRNSELERQLNAMISNQKSSSAVKVDGKDENVSKARQGSSFLTPNVHEFLGYIPGSLWIQRNLTQNQPEVIEEKTITSLNTSTSESNSDGRVSMFVDDKSWTSMLQSKGQEFSKE